MKKKVAILGRFEYFASWVLLSSLEEEEEEGADLKDTTEMRYPIKSMAVYELEAIQANASDPEPVKKQWPNS